MTDLQRCRVCKNDKSLSEFGPGLRGGKSTECYKCQAVRLQRYRKVDPIAKLLAIAKHRAKKAGIEFSLKETDVSIPLHCPYLGIELTTEVGNGWLPSAASLDRVDNSKGYVPGNVRVISLKANKMKSNCTKTELIMFANAILVLHPDNG